MEYSEWEHCTICVHLYGACTKKRNIENERNVHGKRLRVFSTKGEKLELPPTSKSLLSIASIFFSIPRFFRQHRCSFSFILSTFQLATSCGSEEILTSIYPIGFVLLLVPIFKIKKKHLSREGRQRLKIGIDARRKNKIE